MSSFSDKVKDKNTGEIKTCLFLDDYFGRHAYGYHIDGETLTADEFEERYERLKPITREIVDKLITRPASFNERS